LDKVLAVVQSDLELVISEKAASILSDPLPTVKGVPNQMHQLLYNLINNALKFSKPGESPCIIITCTELSVAQMIEHKDLNQSQKYYSIIVQDNGIGFSQDYAEKIFDMFQRLHSKDAYAGTGIGLALVKKVVSNHGGKLWAESIPGEGSAFTILLPME
jgi:signal transduction histidine kinase